MDCATARELLSAQLDGEDDPTMQVALDDHMETCHGCTSWQTEAASLHRSIRVGLVGSMPGPPTALLARAGVPDVGRGEWVRVMLGAVAVVLAGHNLPLLILGHGVDADVHVGRHLGAFGIALAIGLGYAALRPERALGMLPLGGALGVALLATSTIDVATGASTAQGEILHLLELAGVILLWVLSGGRHRLTERLAAFRPRRNGPAGLHAVRGVAR